MVLGCNHQFLAVTCLYQLGKALWLAYVELYSEFRSMY